MKTFEKLIRKHIQGKKVLMLFILTNLVYVAMLTITIPMVMGFANGMKLLDMMPLGYDFEYVHELFRALGPKGRDVYFHNQIPLDMVYPALFAIGYSLVMGYFLNRLGKLQTPLIYLCLLPFVAGAADYAENIGIITILNNYPEISKSTVTITSAFSFVKSMATTLYFVILISSLVMLGIGYLKK